MTTSFDHAVEQIQLRLNECYELYRRHKVHNPPTATQAEIDRIDQLTERVDEMMAEISKLAFHAYLEDQSELVDDWELQGTVLWLIKYLVDDPTDYELVVREEQTDESET